jgi:hypothetical protein
VLALDTRKGFIWLVGAKRDAFAVLPANELGHFPSLPQAAFEGDFVVR